MELSLQFRQLVLMVRARDTFPVRMALAALARWEQQKALRLLPERHRPVLQQGLELPAPV